MTWRLVKTQDGEWHEYRLFKDGDFLAAYARWRLLPGGNAELHNEIFETSKSVLVKAREIFHETLRPHMRNAGAERVVVVNTEEEAAGKMVKYWGFMGFEYICGIMEA